MARLLLDAMLGRLATYLRMCGHDAAYALDRDVEADEDLLELARLEDRRVVTRDRQLAARAPAAVLLESTAIEDQLRAVRDAGLDLSLDEPLRCSSCNGPLDRVPRAASTPEQAPTTDEQPVWRCVDCGQHFWRGSHWDDVAETIDEL
jgi:uncharacterized protein with PIN domain